VRDDLLSEERAAMPAGARPPDADQEVEQVVYRGRQALAKLMHAKMREAADGREAVYQITETAAQVLEVERTSVWRLIDDETAIECVDLFERTAGRHSSGVRIRASDAPRYFEALRCERAIRADDARTDERTSEFRAEYLDPLGITSMLDAPIFVRGAMVGVVCNEHVGSPRRWTFADELLAGTFADFAALNLETDAWRRAENALRTERDALESKVRERTRALQESESSLRSLLELSPVPMVLTRTSDNSVAFANRRAAEMMGVPMETVLGRNAPDFWAVPGDRTRYLTELDRDGRVDGLEAKLRTLDGREFWARVSGQRLRFAGEDTLLSAMVDITEQKLAQDRLRDLATQDALTRTYNRRYVEDLLRRELERARRYRRPLAVAMLDADHFKRVNDAHGHQGGDDVLREMSDRFRRTLRANDVLARYGGEEFLVVFPETLPEEAVVVCERLREAISSRGISVGDQRVRVTVSIGVAAASEGEEPASLIARADTAMYTAKHDGRNLVRMSRDSVPNPLGLPR
jgi:diguanylate cyclase (GGDEF)-like protein/PAS domain S-box-containing protein